MPAKAKAKDAGARPVRRGRRARRERRASRRAAGVRPRRSSGGCRRRISRPTRRKPSPTLPRPPTSISSAPRRNDGADLRLIDLEVERGGAAARHHGDRGRQRQHAVPARFDPRRARRAGLRAAARRASDPRRRARRERRPRAPRRRGDRGGPGRRPARELHPHPSRPHRRRGGARAPRRGADQGLCRRRRRGARLARHARPASPRRSTPIAPTRRRCRPTRSPRRSPSSNGSPTTISPSSACASTACPKGDAAADPVEASGLGLLRDPTVQVLRRGARARRHDARRSAPSSPARRRSSSPRRTSSRACTAASISTTSASSCSRPKGASQGELRIIGLFTSNAYTSSPQRGARICATRSRKVVGARRLRPGELRRPRAPQRARELSARRAVPDRRGDALPLRDRDHEPVRAAAHPRARAAGRVRPLRLGARLHAEGPLRHRRCAGASASSSRRVYKGRVSAAYPAYPEGPLARTHYIIGRDEGATPADRPQDDARGRHRARSCAPGPTRLRDGARRDDRRPAGPRARGALRRRLLGRLSRSLRAPSKRSPTSTILERLSDERPRAVDLYRRERRSRHARQPEGVLARRRAAALRTRAAAREPRLPASSTSGPTGSTPAGRARTPSRVWLHDMALERAAGGAIDIAAIEGPIEAALLALFRGLAESDGFNTLVLEAGLGWRDVAMLRAFGRYLRQIRLAFGQDYLAATLARHGAIARKIVELFYARFDPRGADAARRGAKRACAPRSRACCRRSTSLDDDRILRRFVNLVEAAVRTNFFQIDENGLPRQTIAFKFECAPGRRPAAAEAALRDLRLLAARRGRCICASARSPAAACAGRTGRRISAPRCSGSSRRSRSRTPSSCRSAPRAASSRSSCRRPATARPGSRRAPRATASSSARCSSSPTTSSATTIVPPPDTVRHDGDDPYLVVAADKGTATFSDIANAISIEKGYWLGDAFASGGSQGYDHKKMGITARGAWEAVKRHFREIDIDIQTQPVTVAGVGDMSGDVFGNGMLLVEMPEARRRLRPPRHLHRSRLPIRPRPRPSASACSICRARAGRTTTSRKISKGGGIFPRAAKSIPLSPRGAGRDRPRRRPRRRPPRS